MLALLLRLDTPQVAQADSASSGATGDYIAITGSDNTGLGVIYVFNAKTQKMAVYQWDRNFLYLLGLRDLRVDFTPEIDIWNNPNKQKITPADIKAEVEKMLKQREKERR